MTTPTTATIEHAYGLFIILGSDAFRPVLSIDEHLMVAEAFDEFTNPTQTSVLFNDALSPKVTNLATILTALRADLAQLIADATHLDEVLRYTRARDLLEHVTGRS